MVECVRRGGAAERPPIWVRLWFEAAVRPSGSAVSPPRCDSCMGTLGWPQRVHGMMQPRRDKSLELIGDGLRHFWRDVVVSPLPGQIQRLLEELQRNQDAGCAKAPPGSKGATGNTERG